MLEATRTRISFSAEVLTAALFLSATVLVGLLIVRELRVAPRAAARADASPVTSDAVPPEAVSVPALTFGVHEIRVGDAEAAVLGRLDASIALAKNTVESGPLGPRVIRAYELAGLRFILVAEPFERGGEPRLSAIYLQ